MKKIILLLALSLFVIFPAFMEGSGEATAIGAVSITKKLSVIKTEYFDFIFPEESEPTAQYLAQKADDLYRKATSFLNIESTLRFPVVVTPETDLINAYFAPLPMFRIVMYDTVPFDALAVYSDNIASIFYHELIHALSMTIRTPFWQEFSDIFGDMPSLDMILNLPKSISEGTAVFAESMDGDGRLNSAYALHVIKQAKIEGKFPDWRDIAGAYQLYTDGSLPYIFGGAFLNYAYETYGAKKFTDFWYELAISNITVYEGAFEKVYAVSLDDVWQDFENSISIAPLSPPAQPLFLEKTVLNATNDHLFQHLTASPNGIAWQDGFTGNVYFLPNGSENKKPQTLYAKDSYTSVDVGRLHFSRDGKYLASSGYIGSASLGTKTENIVRVYDMERGKFIHTKKGIREGTVLNIPQNTAIASDSPFYGISTVLAGIQTDGGFSSLVFYDMDAEKNSPHLLDIPFARSSILFEPLDAGNGLLVALMHNKGKWQFFAYDTITGTQRTYAIADTSLSPSNIGDIYASDTMLYMSYAPTPASQPVLARINLADFNSDALTVYVQTEQVSGGIFAPVVVSATVNGDNQQKGETAKIAHISKYYEHRDLSLLPIDRSDSFETLTFAAYTDSSIENPLELPTALPLEPYNSLKYMLNGIMLPMIGPTNIAFMSHLPLNLYSVSVTGLTTDPTGRILLQGSAGYDIQAKNVTASLTTVFNENYFNAATDIFVATGFTQFETFASRLQTNFRIPIGYNFNNLTFANTLSYFYLAEKTDDLLDGNTVFDKVSVSFSHMRRTGQYFYEKAGVTFGATASIEKNFTHNTALTHEYAVFLGVNTPFVLPFKNPDRFTVNLPSEIFAYRHFNSEKVWELKTNFVVFAYNIQKPLQIPLFPLFFQRITLDAGLDTVWNKADEAEMTLHGNLFVTLTPNTSFLVGIPIDLGASFTWEPHIGGIKGLEVSFKFGVNL